jgi:hypothetical protein
MEVDFNVVVKPAIMTGTLRDAATLLADKVAHPFDIPALLRHAASTIDNLRTRLGDALTDAERLRHGVDVEQ